MNTAGLSFEQGPPFSVPLRFFLTAPWFLVLAAVLISWEGPVIFASRWLPSMLALTHLLVLGFMAQTMLGALLQILPVAVGVSVPYPRLTAALIHIPLTLGTLTLVGAFLFSEPVLFAHAVGLLGLGFGVALIAFNIAVWRAPVAGGTVIALRCALIALLVTVLFGLLLASGLSWGWSLPVVMITELHAVWGLAGWTPLLLAGVAYQVVPMFHITPTYPTWLTRSFAPGMTGLFIAWTVLTLAGWPTVAMWVRIALTFGLIVLAIVTLYLFTQRRRKIGDPTLGYWRISMVSLFVGAGLWVLTQWLPALALAPQVELLLGVLLIVGFAIAVINGMLYKIVPFLAWFHLQARFLGQAKVPNMKQLLPDAPIQRQMWGFLATVVLLLAAVIYPIIFTYPAALALGITGAWLGVNMFNVAWFYRRWSRQNALV
ncbi:MAG: hypothetical protein QG599_232 [Pseudomonadota bacterium]|nr:hypothetical protein [Pseudomonadota bacterium]